jgi:hypothetical protein
MQLTKRSVAALAGVAGALAIAAPIADAGAATTPAALPAFSLPTFSLPTLGSLPALGSLPTIASLPAFSGVPISFVGPSVGFVGVAIGPTVINSVFNGATVVQVVNGPAGSSVIGSP